MFGELNFLSSRKTALGKNEGLKKYLGQKVFTKDGATYGKVIDVVFNGYDVDGIFTSKFKFFKKTFIDREYLEKFTNEGILLKINPVLSIKGKLVFDKDGRSLGKVKKINRRTKANTYESLTIKKGIIGRQKMIYPQDIRMIEKNIILKVSYEK